jgi:hypothetical protein
MQKYWLISVKENEANHMQQVLKSKQNIMLFETIMLYTKKGNFLLILLKVEKTFNSSKLTNQAKSVLYSRLNNKSLRFWEPNR